MVRSKRKSEKSVQKETDKNISKKSYDQEFELKKLRVLCIIVNRYQGDYFINEFARREVGASFLVYGTGTATKEIYDILGIGETKKDIVLSLVKESDIPELKKLIEARFNVSKKAKGIAFFIGIDSIAGVLIYKYLTNTKENIKRKLDHE